MTPEKKTVVRVGPDHRGANATYRRAILKALESLHDYQTRSNIDAIRRHTQDLLEDQTWNDALFLQTLKSVVRKGELDLFVKSTVEFSPQFKRQRADSLLHRVDDSLLGVNNVHHLQPAPLSPSSLDSSSGSNSNSNTNIHLLHELKPAPKRRSEHEKWKIVPKKIYDHSTIVNPMDTH